MIFQILAKSKISSELEARKIKRKVKIIQKNNNLFHQLESRNNENLFTICTCIVNLPIIV